MLLYLCVQMNVVRGCVMATFIRTLKMNRTLLRYDEVDDHGGAAGEGGLGPDVEVVDGLGAHEGHL